jgi:hypothetical protein
VQKCFHLEDVRFLAIVVHNDGYGSECVANRGSVWFSPTQETDPEREGESFLVKMIGKNFPTCYEGACIDS